MTSIRVALMVTALVLGGCRGAGDVTGPDDPARGRPVFMTQEGCEMTPGCSENEDPDPEAPGYWLGSTVTPGSCYSPTGAGINDADRDSLHDYCEQRLADRFAPQLAYWSGDNVGREPRWAARTQGPSAVRIGYFLSYYMDLGAEGLPCCAGSHYGDREYVVLDVEYESSTRHWVLRAAWYSQHTSFGLYWRGTEYPVDLVYPDQPGGYPRVYVSGYKHANYATQAECDAGGIFGLDWCSPNSFARLTAPSNRNIGSRYFHTPAQDCVSSTNPLYANNGVVECYWTGQRFTGWQGTLPASDPYSPVLSFYRF